MEKEVKKKRVSKKAGAPKESAQEVEKVEAVTPVETAEKPQKAARKPRAKKTEKPAEEKAEIATTEKVETVPAEETPAEKKEAKPKTARKPRAKKAVEEKPIEEAKPTEDKHELTRQEKKDAVRAIVKELLSKGNLRRSALIDEASKAYVERYPSAETANVNDVKGRVGSVITLMEQGLEIFYVDGVMRLDKPLVETVIIKEEKAAESEAEPVPAPVKEAYLPVPVPESKLAPVFDLSALLGEKKAVKAAKKDERKEDDQKKEKAKPAEKSAEKSQEKASAKTTKKAKGVTAVPEKITVKKLPKPKTDDKLKEKFLKKIRSHGGTYLEYYAIYLLQRYAQANGRRLEGLRVCGGKADGGIDGEIEVSDRLGFRETLYIQAKNWEPTDEKWVVGETLLQQFIGAVTYRMVQEGKAHGRGVYVTTSKFSEGARKMLDDLSEKFVGYDGDELFDLAKECRFGLIEKDGEWVLDENLLVGERAFFNM